MTQRVRRRDQGVPPARLRRRRQDLPAGGPDRADQPIQRRPGADPLEAWRHRLGAHHGRVRSAVAELAEDLLAIYAARASAPGFELLRRTLPGSASSRRRSLHRDPRPGTDHHRGQGGHASPPADGPASSAATSATARPRSHCAAFKAVQDGKQVAVLVPTTVLAQQHLGTFRRRLAPFPVRVEMLSRFVGKAEQTKIVEATTGGEVDILIGTHRILSKDIAFADLGAGGRRGAALRGRPQGAHQVDARETCHPLRHAHPATLHLSLVGIRDLERHRDAAGGAVADPDPHRRGRRRPGARRDQPRARPRRAGLYVHNRVETIEGAAERATPGAAGQGRHRPWADGGGDARAGDARLRRRQVRRAGLHHHHRVGARHPECEHDHHRPGRCARPGAALPACAAGSAAQTGEPTRTSSTAADSRCRRSRASGSMPSSRRPTWGRATDRPLRPRDPGRGTFSVPSSTASWRRSASSSTPACWPRRWTRGRAIEPEPAGVRLDLPGSAYLPDDYVADAGAKLEAYWRFAAIHAEADVTALERACATDSGRHPSQSKGCSGRSRCAWRPSERACPRCRGRPRHPEVAALRPLRGRAGLDVGRLPADAASNQVRIPVPPGRDPVETAMRALLHCPRRRLRGDLAVALSSVQVS